MLNRLIAGVTSFCFFVTLFYPYSANAAEILHSAPTLAIAPNQIAIPAEMGQVGERFVGTNGQLVLYIQDAHANFDAQMSIAEIISHLSQVFSIKLIAVEGYAGEIDLSLFRAFSDQRVKEDVLRQEVRRGKVTGPEYAAILHDQLPDKLIGVEDKELYLSNLKSYLKSFEIQQDLKPLLEQLKQHLSNLETHLYSEPLKRLEKNQRSFQAGTLDLKNYYEFLKGSSLSPETLKLTPEAFFKELKQYESSTREKLFQNEAQRELFQYQEYLSLVDKLLELKLTREEYGELQATSHKPQSASLSSFIEKQSQRHHLKLNHLEKIKSYDFDKAISELSHFYELALKRDVTLIDNLKREMDKRKTSISIFVTGGYHQDGVLKQLKDSNISYVSIQPAIQNIPKKDGLYAELMEEQGKYFSNSTLSVPANFVVTEGFGFNNGPAVEGFQKGLLKEFLVQASSYSEDKLNILIKEINRRWTKGLAFWFKQQIYYADYGEMLKASFSALHNPSDFVTALKKGFHSFPIQSVVSLEREKSAGPKRIRAISETQKVLNVVTGASLGETASFISSVPTWVIVGGSITLWIVSMSLILYLKYFRYPSFWRISKGYWNGEGKWRDFKRDLGGIFEFILGTSLLYLLAGFPMTDPHMGRMTWGAYLLKGVVIYAWISAGILVIAALGLAAQQMTLVRKFSPKKIQTLSGAQVRAASNETLGSLLRHLDQDEDERTKGNQALQELVKRRSLGPMLVAYGTVKSPYAQDAIFQALIPLIPIRTKYILESVHAQTTLVRKIDLRGPYRARDMEEVELGHQWRAGIGSIGEAMLKYPALSDLGYLENTLIPVWEAAPDEAKSTIKNLVDFIMSGAPPLAGTDIEWLTEDEIKQFFDIFVLSEGDDLRSRQPFRAATPDKSALELLNQMPREVRLNNLHEFHEIAVGARANSANVFALLKDAIEEMSLKGVDVPMFLSDIVRSLQESKKEFLRVLPYVISVTPKDQFLTDVDFTFGYHRLIEESMELQKLLIEDGHLDGCLKWFEGKKEKLFNSPGLTLQELRVIGKIISNSSFRFYTEVDFMSGEDPKSYEATQKFIQNIVMVLRMTDAKKASLLLSNDKSTKFAALAVLRNRQWQPTDPGFLSIFRQILLTPEENPAAISFAILAIEYILRNNPVKSGSSVEKEIQSTISEIFPSLVRELGNASTQIPVTVSAVVRIVEERIRNFLPQTEANRLIDKAYLTLLPEWIKEQKHALAAIGISKLSKENVSVAAEILPSLVMELGNPDLKVRNLAREPIEAAEKRVREFYSQKKADSIIADAYMRALPRWIKDQAMDIVVTGLSKISKESVAFIVEIFPQLVKQLANQDASVRSGAQAAVAEAIKKLREAFPEKEAQEIIAKTLTESLPEMIKSQGAQEVVRVVKKIAPLAVRDYERAEREINGHFDSNNPWHRLANFAQLKSQPSQGRAINYDEYERLLTGKEKSVDSLIDSQHQVQLRALAYEGYRLMRFITELREEARKRGRKIVVVANRSYGLMAIAPIRRWLEMEGAPLIVTKIGSTDAHTNPLVIDFNNQQLFTDDQIRMFANEKPDVIVVDGSYSVDYKKIQTFRRHDPRFPDAYQGYRNFFIAINDGIQPEKHKPDMEDFQKDKDFLSQLKSDNKFQAIAKKASNVVNKKSNQLYKMRFWTPAFNSADGKLKFSENHQIRRERAPPIYDFKKDADSPALIMVQSSIENPTHPDADSKHPTIPPKVQKWIGGENIPAFFDDTQHFNNLSYAYEEGYGVRFSKVYGTASQYYFEEVLDLLGESDQLKAKIETRTLNGYVFDLTGTLATFGGEIPDFVKEKIELLLRLGKKVAIISDDTEAHDIEVRFINRIDSSLRSNLSVYINGGNMLWKFDSTGKKQVTFNDPMDLVIKQKITTYLESLFKSSGISGYKWDSNDYRVSVSLKEHLSSEKDPKKVRRDLLANIEAGIEKVTGVKPRIYLLGRNHIAMSLKHKPEALEDFLRREKLKPEELLIAGNEAGSRMNDREMIKGFKGAVKINVGHISHSLNSRAEPSVFQIGLSHKENIGILMDCIDEKGNLTISRLRHASIEALEETKGASLGADERKALASAIRSKYEGPIVGVIGAVSPSASYLQEDGVELGKTLASYLRRQGTLFTGGVSGVGEDVFQGFAASGVFQESRFFCLLPASTEPLGYRRLSPTGNVRVENFGGSMFERRIGMGLVADILIVQNGGTGTLHEAAEALKNGKKLIVLNQGGVGALLYHAQQSGKLTPELKQAGISLTHLGQIALGDNGNIQSVLDRILSHGASLGKSLGIFDEGWDDPAFKAERADAVELAKGLIPKFQRIVPEPNMRSRMFNQFLRSLSKAKITMSQKLKILQEVDAWVDVVAGETNQDEFERIYKPLIQNAIKENSIDKHLTDEILNAKTQVALPAISDVGDKTQVKKVRNGQILDGRGVFTKNSPTSPWPGLEGPVDQEAAQKIRLSDEQMEKIWQQIDEAEQKAKRAGRALEVSVPLRGAVFFGFQDADPYINLFTPKSDKVLKNFPSLLTVQSNVRLRATISVARNSKGEIERDKIYYVNETWGYETANQVPIKLTPHLETSDGQRDAVAYILGNVFGLRGLRITVSVDHAAMVIGGGFESSNAYNLSIGVIAQILMGLTGRQVTPAEIFSFLRRAAPQELRDRTGMQGALTAWQSHPVTRHYFLGGIKGLNGMSLNPHAVFSEPIGDISHVEWLRTRTRALMPGIQLIRGERSQDRQDKWTGRMMLDLIEKYPDSKSLEAAERMKELVGSAQKALLKKNLPSLMSAVNEYAEIRYGFQKRWYQLAQNPDHPLHAVLESDEFLKSRDPKNPDLYTGGYSSLLDLARKFEVALAPLGKGGFGANWIIFGEPQNIKLVLRQLKLMRLTDKIADAALKDQTGNVINLKGWVDADLGFGKVGITPELQELNHSPPILDAQYDERSGIATINPAREMWKGVSLELKELNPQIEKPSRMFLSRLYGAMNRTLDSIARKIEVGKIDPSVPLNISRQSAAQGNIAKKNIPREIRVGVLGTAGNPLNWGHVLISLMAMDKMDLDTVVFLVHGDIDYKEIDLKDQISTQARHEMIQKALAPYFPLIRYSDLGLGNSDRAQKLLHDLMRSNPDQEIKFVYISGSETEERLRKMTDLHYKFMKGENFGSNPKHSYEWALIPRGEIGNRLNDDLMSQMVNQKVLKTHIIQDPDIDLDVNSSVYRSSFNPKWVPKLIHRAIVQNGFYGYGGKPFDDAQGKSLGSGNDDPDFVKALSEAMGDKLNYYQEQITRYFSNSNETILSVVTMKGLKELAELKKQGKESGEIIEKNILKDKDAPLLVLQEVGDSEDSLKESLSVLGLKQARVRTLFIQDEVIDEVRLLSFIRDHLEFAKAGTPLKIYAGKEGKLNSFFNRLAFRLPEEWKAASVQIQTLEILQDLIQNLSAIVRMNQSLKIAA